MIQELNSIILTMINDINNDKCFLEKYHLYDIAKEDNGVIYFVKNKNTGSTKIGYTKDITKRLSTLKSQSLQFVGEECLELVKVYPCAVSKLREVEKILHDAFSQHKVVMEWFDITDKDIDDVMVVRFMCDKYNNGEIDVFIGDIEHEEVGDYREKIQFSNSVNSIQPCGNTLISIGAKKLNYENLFLFMKKYEDIVVNKDISVENWLVKKCKEWELI